MEDRTADFICTGRDENLLCTDTVGDFICIDRITARNRAAMAYSRARMEGFTVNFICTGRG